MNKEWELVREFHQKFGHPQLETPRSLDPERSKARESWMREELDEFRDAENIYEQADAMIDLIYFAIGTLVEMGVRPAQLFQIVHEANMSKLWDDGIPRYAVDGKTIKPPTWEDPAKHIIREIESQRDIDKI